MALEALNQIIDIGKGEAPQVEEQEVIIPKTKWLIFYIDGKKYSMKESQVVTILRDVKLFNYPFAPLFIEGVIYSHNKIYSVIDYSKLINEQSNAFDLNLYVVVKTDSDELSLKISGIEDFFMIPDEDYSEEDLTGENNYIQGFLLFNDEKIPVLNISAINKSIISNCKKVGA